MFGCRIVIVFSLLLISFGTFSQQKFTLSGTISDVSSGEDLTGAIISIQNTNYSAVCNSYGFYSITIPENNYSIKVQLLSYENQIIPIKLHSSQVINFKMTPISYELENVEVKGERADRNVTSIDVSSVKMTPKQIESIPVFFGDLI